MISRFTISVAVVLLVSVGASAQTVGYVPTIVQHQGFTVGLDNLVDLLHGQGVAQCNSNIHIRNQHHTFSPKLIDNDPVVGICPGGCVPPDDCKIDPPWCPSCEPKDCEPCITKGSQLQCVDLSQRARTRGDCAVVSANVFLDGYGVQDQTIEGGIGMKDQYQAMGVSADQVLFKSDGLGQAQANHNIDRMAQNQTAINAAGMSWEASTITADQNSFVSGQPTSTGVVANSLCADTEQWQIVF